MENTTGILTIVPTPIGNLGDITKRALTALDECDAVYAEDTRVTGKLLSSLGIKKPIFRMDENSLASVAPEVIEQVLDGKHICYCSDAGMPGISDPGLRLIAALQTEGAPYEVLPGPSAATVAYVASGTPWQTYYFGGFFPRKMSEKRHVLESLELLQAALIFYESPKRLASTLKIMAEVYPLRRACVCRELTKMHEETICGKLPDLASDFEKRHQEGKIKGEVVIVIDGPASLEKGRQIELAHDLAFEEAEKMVRQGMRPKEIAKKLEGEFNLHRNDAYKIALDAKSIGEVDA